MIAGRLAAVRRALAPCLIGYETVASQIADSLHAARTFIAAGVVRPGRPDRVLRALVGLHRWGPTLAAGYLGAAARYPDAHAVIDELGTLTFAEVDRRTNALASSLSQRGIGEGAGVAIMCRNHRGFVEASIACSKLGAHTLYLNTAFAGPQVSEVVDRENPAAIIYDQDLQAAAGDACSEPPGVRGLAGGRRPRGP